MPPPPYFSILLTSALGKRRTHTLRFLYTIQCAHANLSSPSISRGGVPRSFDARERLRIIMVCLLALTFYSILVIIACVCAVYHQHSLLVNPIIINICYTVYNPVTHRHVNHNVSGSNIDASHRGKGGRDVITGPRSIYPLPNRLLAFAS
jgi:hypothetical protein